MNEQFFTQKLLESEPMLYRIGCSLLSREADRQDAMQETALKAWQGCGRLREERYFKTWIARIMINECRSLHRRTRRLIPMDNVPEQPTPEKDELETRLMLERLPEKQRVPIVLHYLEGFSLEEIARVQQISLGMVKYRMYQARRTLRVEWNGKEEERK